MKIGLVSDILATIFFYIFIILSTTGQLTLSLNFIGIAVFMKLNAMDSRPKEKQSASLFNPNANTFLKKIKQENIQGTCIKCGEIIDETRIDTDKPTARIVCKKCSP